VGLEGIRRIAGLEIGSQDALGLAAGAAGYGQVVEGQIRVLLAEDVHERIQAYLLRAVSPPGKDPDRAGCFRRVRFFDRASSAACGQEQACCRNAGEQRYASHNASITEQSLTALSSG
jgi:hypothetical protein